MENKILKGIIEEGKPESIKSNMEDCREKPEPLYIFPSAKQILNRVSDEELKKLNEEKIIFGKESDK